MSVTSVSSALPTPYGSVSGISSRGVKYVAPVDPFRPPAGTRADGRTAGPTVTADADAADRNRSQSAFADSLRADGAGTAGDSSDETSGSGGTQSPAGIALYKRVSLIGNNESSPSALLKSWNSIVQGADDDGTGAATLQAFLQNGAPGLGSGILDVTA